MFNFVPKRFNYIHSRRDEGNDRRKENWDTRRKQFQASLNPIAGRPELQYIKDNSDLFQGSKDPYYLVSLAKNRFQPSLDWRVAREINARQHDHQITPATVEDVTDAAHATEKALRPTMENILKRLARAERELVDLKREQSRDAEEAQQ